MDQGTMGRGYLKGDFIMGSLPLIEILIVLAIIIVAAVAVKIGITFNFNEWGKIGEKFLK